MSMTEAWTAGMILAVIIFGFYVIAVSEMNK
jgi:hypothetical protein